MALEEGAEKKDYAEEVRENIVDITHEAEQRQQSVEDDSLSESMHVWKIHRS